MRGTAGPEASAVGRSPTEPDPHGKSAPNYPKGLGSSKLATLPPTAASNPLGELAHHPEAFARFESFISRLEETAQAVARTFAEQDIEALAEAAEELSVRADPEGGSALAHLAWKLRHSANVSHEFTRLAADAQSLAPRASSIPL